MPKSYAKAQIEGAVKSIKGWNKLDAIGYLIPQQLKDGKLMNVKGLIIGSWEGQDQEFFPKERLLDATKCTDALIRDVTANLVKFINGEADEVEPEDTDEVAPVEDAPSEAEAVEPEAEEKPVTKNLLKELKKELKSLEKGSKEYKKLKKQIKKLKGE